MAQGSAKQVKNGRDTFGGRFYGTVDYSGPASYAGGATGGDLVDPHWFAFYNTIQSLEGAIDQSGTYIAVPQTVNNGVTAWKIRWFTVVGMTEVTNGTALNGVTVRLSAIGY
ncbi:MAG TPA: hypothetical protein VGK96_28445 [Candidatus Sulfotelmatobacter sp.]|jgi:hypothetical protein